MDNNDYTKEGLKLGELIGVQDKAVVSKTLINKPAGTVTLFGFDTGEKLSEHTAPFDALVSIIEGDMSIFIEGRPFRLSAGEMIIMPADRPHALEALSPCKMMLVMIK
ncbi:MAG TPA: cupin domain-containing protein [Spirochaetota bacterium]|nr:cupin domain-containing protein [Spirochaetota bacterium]